MDNMTTDLSQIESSIVDVKKRDGRITAFNKEKITNAIYKVLVANDQLDSKIPGEKKSVSCLHKYEKNKFISYAGMVHASQKMSCIRTNKIGSMVRLNQRSRYFFRSVSL
jgi:hypothetical protein